MQDYNQAFAFVSALTQSDANSVVIDVRMIHDTDKAVAAIPRRGRLPDLWNEIVAWNNSGYGVFININEMDGSGKYEIGNVAAIRCQAVDLDNINAADDYARAAAFNPAPCIAVQSSPGKYHLYWITQRHTNRDGFTLLQRKLRTLFNGDKRVIDPSRVLRLPGTFHLKNPAAPHLITSWALSGYGSVIDPTFLEIALSGVNVVDGVGGRHELGSPDLAAPSLDWLWRALELTDPNSLDRGEWISFTSAWKQAGYSLTSEQQLFQEWSRWCAQYNQGEGDNPGENRKNWESIRNTEIGWPTLAARNPVLKASLLSAEQSMARQQPHQPQPTHQQPPQPDTAPFVPPPPPLPPLGEFLSDDEQKRHFEGCVFIARMGTILTPLGRFMNQTQFNGWYGGHKFIIDSAGKTSTEAWAAATRSTLWQIPKADHIRFLPAKPHGALIEDDLGRIGVNTYKPARIKAEPGDVSLFLRHMELLIPTEIDRSILLKYMAHNAKYPGYKIPWAPLIQSAEGAGKNAIKEIVKHMVGGAYFHSPNAQELAESGSKFNAWMRSKLMILVDEIRVGDKLDMIEILKPMISEKVIEIQGKGQDQELEDNYANWWFFSNYKNAIPVNSGSRRYAVFYSPLQTAGDILRAGMDGAYFDRLYGWLENGGTSHVTHWLQNYPIERGTIEMRAPHTTSTFEAVRQSRSPLENVILDAVQDGLPGFLGGWVSYQAVIARVRAHGNRPPSLATVQEVLERMGYYHVGRASRPFFAENKDIRSELFSIDRYASVEMFGDAQGYK